MEAGLSSEPYFETLWSPTTTVKSKLHTYWTYVCKFVSAKRKSRMRVLDCSNDQNLADGNVECRVSDVSAESICDDSNVIWLNALRASHGVEQVAIHSQVASQWIAIVNVHNADTAMYGSSTSTITNCRYQELVKPRAMCKYIRTYRICFKVRHQDHCITTRSDIFRNVKVIAPCVYRGCCVKS
jgi:hypothetical protein